MEGVVVKFSYVPRPSRDHPQRTQVVWRCGPAGESSVGWGGSVMIRDERHAHQILGRVHRDDVYRRAVVGLLDMFQAGEEFQPTLPLGKPGL